MADAKAQFAVELKDETTGAAKAAADALDKLERQISRDQKALKDLERTMRSSKKASFDANTDYIGLAASIQKKRDAVAGASRDFLALGGSFGMASRRAKEGAAASSAIAAGLSALHNATAKAANDNAKPTSPFNPKLWELAAQRQQGFARSSAVLASSLAKVGPAAGGLAKVGAAADATMPKVQGATGKVQGLIEKLGTGGLPFAALTAAAALVALSAAAAGMVVGGLLGLIKYAVSSQEELAGVSQAAINVAKRSPIARTEIAKLATELEKTGLKGAALEAALESAVSKKFGKEASKSMLSLSVQLAKAKENATLLFTGVRTGPLLSAAKDLFSLLDESSSVGKALKALAETLLNPIIGAAPSAASALKSMFKGAVIGALQLGIAVLLVRNRVRDMLSVDIGGWQVDWVKVGTAALVFAAAVGVVAAAVGVVAGIVLGSVVAVAALAFGFGLLAVKAWQTGAAIVGGIAKAVATLWNYASSFVSMGVDFVAGLASGILSGLSSVITAATKVAKGAITAVKNVLQERSPSRVMFLSGRNTSRGMAKGIDAGAPEVKTASENMVHIPRDSDAGGAATAVGGGGGVTVRIEKLEVNGVQGADDPSFPRQVAEVLEQAATMLGVKLAVS